MNIDAYEIRLCQNCGLRYPLVKGHAFGTRCPICLGATNPIASHPLQTESRRPFNKPAFQLEVLLDNIRSAWNVGSIFRTADGFGFSRIHLCGITPTPENEAVKKTSLGAEEIVSWTYHKDAVKAAHNLKSQGYQLLALEEDKRAIDIHNAHVGEKNVVILGNEVTGVDPELLDLCDEIVFIPMRGGKKSFNVATAFGVAAYALHK